MELPKLISRIPQDMILSERLSDPDVNVWSIAFLTAATEAPRDDVLYFCDATQLPESLGEDGFSNFLVFGGSEADTTLADNGQANIITISGDLDPFDCYNTLQSFFIEDQQQTAIVRRMLTAHFSDKGLSYLVEEASKALDNPVLVIDQAFRYVAHATGPLDDDSRFSEVMSRELRYEAILEDGVDYIKSEAISEKVSRHSGPLEHFNKLFDLDTLVSAVMVHGICIAHVMLIARNHPFTDIDRVCFSRLTHFVAQEMQKSTLYETPPGQMNSYFLSYLLNEEHPNRMAIQRRMEVLDLKPAPKYYLVCVQPADASVTAIDLESVASQLRCSISHTITTVCDRELVLLVGRKPDQGIGDYTMRAFSNAAQVSQVSVGISNPFEDIAETRDHLRQARSAITFGKLVSSQLDDHSVYRYRDFAYIELLDVASHDIDLINFCDPALRKLQEYDKRHNGELVETLFCYLQTMGNTQRASRLLNLHKNTMLYRMSRIREITGCDLSSGEDVFKLQVSYRVLLFLGLFSSRIQVEREDLGAQSEA